MPNKTTVQALVDAISQGRILEAFEEFYADDVVMQENSHPATEGKAANRVREEEFVSKVGEVFENRALAVLVDGDQSALQWVIDFRNKDGVRIRINQVAIQTWKDEKIVAERFYYDSANVVVAE